MRLPFPPDWLCRKPALQVGLAGAFALVVVAAALSRIDTALYLLRDDGLITMSHARNLVDYGFIGVNPSGPRVEGFSAPVQFWSYWLAYLLAGTGPLAFAVAQTVIATAGLGMAGYCLIAQSGARPAQTGALFAAATVCLVAFTPFLLWHASGMENAITNMLFVLTIFILHRSCTTGRTSLIWAVPVFAATISRLDSVYHLAPLLGWYALAFHLRHKSMRGVLFAAAVFVLWVSYQAWRWHYFGDLTPNTARAQGIDMVRNVKAFILDPLGTLAAKEQLLTQAALMNGALLVAPALLAFLPVRHDGVSRFLAVMLGSLTLSAVNAPIVFGFPTLDPARTMSFLAPCALYITAGIAARMLYLGRGHPRLVTTASAAALAGVVAISHVPAYELCCSTEDFDGTRHRFATAGRVHDLPRPLVANPDLGLMSWHKQFNILDLGWLGSALTARLRDDSRLPELIFEYALPDFIELHGYWTGRYQHLLDDPRFARTYVALTRVNPQEGGNGEPASEYWKYWMRRDVQAASGSAERQFIDVLGESLAADAVAREIASCGEGVSPLPAPCRYIVRTVYRLAPELRAAGTFDPIAAMLVDHGVSAYGRYLLTGSDDATGYRAVIDALAAPGAGSQQ